MAALVLSVGSINADLLFSVGHPIRSGETLLARDRELMKDRSESGSIASTSPRTSRWRYVLTGDDVLAARRVPEAIARGSYPIDMQNPSGSGTTTS
jgi:hypothetical protein